MDNQKNEMKVAVVELRIQVNGLQETIDGLVQKLNMLEEALATKVDITHIQEVIKQSEVIKKINDSKSVGISLDGRVIAESIVEQTTDGFKMSATDIKGARVNETK
ncbi:hypothetical protein [Bacillus nitratireducens]|uniref:hypothetical protein n=1 Tax=Bacillus nitratireducens TaxID=2026193 RepID=UPI0011A4071F|nr:hypothetical protein [Bacillus nitratireducens]MDR4171199.1 hypothetical protein [Bacillus nitratireducens]